jgi:hypothetical protein
VDRRGDLVRTRRIIRPGAVTALLTGWALALICAAPAAAQDVGYTASFFVAHSGAPTVTYDSVYLFNSVDLTSGPLRFTLSVPWARQHLVSEEAVNPIDGSVIPAADTVTTGFGDPLARVDVRLVDDWSRALQIAVVGSVKLPVVDPEGGLGTGETDLGFGVSAYKGAGRTSLLIDAVYWKYGDPEGVDFEDALSYSVGVARMVGTGKWSAMASLSGFTSAFEGLSAPVQLNVGLLSLVGRSQSLAISAGFGLTDSAGDFSIGTSWRISR